jgi:hypothetical protein
MKRARATPRADALTSSNRGFSGQLRQRMQRFGLELRPQKTRIIEFGRHAERKRKARKLGKPETFAFLGFTHICGTSRGGALLILRHTVRERLREKLRQVKETIWRMMHRPIAEQGLYLKRVVKGFLNGTVNPAIAKLTVPIQRQSEMRTARCTVPMFFA